MVTRFGKEIRKLRIESDATLYEMAKKMDMTPSYLSAIENGKRQVTGEILNKVIKYFGITKKSVIDKLTKAASEQLETVNLNLSNSSSNMKDTMLMFARSADALTDLQVEKIRKIIDGVKDE